MARVIPLQSFLDDVIQDIRGMIDDEHGEITADETAALACCEPREGSGRAFEGYVVLTAAGYCDARR